MKKAKKTIKRISKRVTEDQDRKYFSIVLILAAITAGLLALWIGMRQSIWFDEAYSIIVAKESAGKLLTLVAADTHPPLYYLTLRAWGETFGWSEFALRSLSVLFYAGSIGFAGALVRRCFGNKAAIGTLVFLVLAPLLMRYGFEIRMYSMASFIGVAATYIMVRALQAPQKDQILHWIVYAILVAAGMYTLYYMALLWIAHAVWLTWLALRSKTKKTEVQWQKQPWLFSMAGAFVLFLPWMPRFLSQVSNDALAPIGQQMTLENLIGVLTFNFLYEPLWKMDIVSSLLMLFVLVTTVFVIIRAAKNVKGREYYVLFALYIAVPILLLVLISILKPMYVERYLSHVAIGFVMLIGISVWLAEQHKPSRLMRFSAGLLLVIMLVGFTNLVVQGNYNFQRLQKPNMEYVASKLVKPCRDGDAILANDPYVAIELRAIMPYCQVNFYSENSNLGGGYAPLSNSLLRVESPVGRMTSSNKLHYVYYGEPDVRFKDDYTPTNREKYGPVNVAEFSAE